MIAGDQPTIFPAAIVAAVSSIEDGSMKDGEDLLTADAIANREKFLRSQQLNPDHTAVFFASFDTEDYCRYKEAAPGLMPGIDAVSTNRRGQPILLPLADCVGAVIYDPNQCALMVSHLGRHSTEQLGAMQSIAYMTKQYGSQPQDLLVWLGPSPNGDAYPLWKFDNRGFTEVLYEQLVGAGVERGRIEISQVDTSTNPHYFSHSQFLKGRQAADGRYAIVAMLK